jgi:hypothetical protein
MKELNKNSRFINKSDIASVLRGKVSAAEIDRALTLLCEDGTIHSGFSDDVYSITE